MGDSVLHDTSVKRIGLIGASFGTGNMGVGALAAGSIRCLSNQWPEAEVYILDYAKQPSSQRLWLGGKQLDIHLLNIRFSKKLLLANNIALLLLLATVMRFIPSARARGWLAARNSTMQQIYNTDLFASIAGGDSFSDIYGLRRLFYVALPQILVIVAGRRLILLPQTFGPFHSRVSRVIAGFITRNSETVFARDHQSLSEITRLNGRARVRSKAAFRYDVGFALEPTAPTKVTVSRDFDMNARKVVGLNVSGLLHMGGYDRRNMFGLRLDYRELMTEILSLLIENRGASVLLVPHVFGDDLQSESDVVACNAVYEECKERYGARIGVLQGDYDQGEIKHVIGSCDFFIGSRMHACIAAVSQGVPTVAIAYSDKFIGVMETVSIPGVVADARRLNLADLLERIAESYDARHSLRADLEKLMPAVTTAAIRPFSDEWDESARSASQPIPDLIAPVLKD